MFKEVRDQNSNLNGSYLDGQLLIAMPSINDPRFDRAVIYMCAHSSEGAMGIIINQQAPHISFSELIEQLDILPKAKGKEHIILPSSSDGLPVHMGGPVETGRGFVLHSSDYHADDATLSIDGSVSLTATVDILRAIALGQGPDHALLALGYAGWSPGQLENEIQANGWLNCPADLDLIFDKNLDIKYDQALGRLGVNPSFLVNDVGHA